MRKNYEDFGVSFNHKAVAVGDYIFCDGVNSAISRISGWSTGSAREHPVVVWAKVKEIKGKTFVVVIEEIVDCNMLSQWQENSVKGHEISVKKANCFRWGKTKESEAWNRCVWEGDYEIPAAVL